MRQIGKFITLYGINNIGKTTQATRLVNRVALAQWNMPPPVYVKYAQYEVKPSGPIINNYLRPIGGRKNPHKLSPREFQMLQVVNRMQFEPKLLLMLNYGISVIAEDYTGTGIAWGMGTDVSKDFLIEINSHLVKEDIAILMDGERFLSSKEENHSHEEDSELTKRVRQIHLELAQEFGWHIVNANQQEEKVHEDIWQIIEPIL